MTAHLWVGHVNLVRAVLPPSLLVAGRSLFLVPPRRPVRAGVLLGVALAVQLGLHSQTVALGALVLVLAAVVLACHRPSAHRERLPNVALMAAVRADRPGALRLSAPPRSVRYGRPASCGRPWRSAATR